MTNLVLEGFEVAAIGHCCSKPSICNMDHTVFANAEGHLFFWQIQGFTDPVHITNRSCAKCGMHWYGREGAVKSYNKNEWSEFVEQEHRAVQ